MKGLYRILAFIAKEIEAIILQPQLLALLVAGPFLVLLAFGLGYQPRDVILRTIVVQVPPDDPRQAIDAYLGSIGPPLQVIGTSADLAPALDRLQAQEADLVVMVPPGIRDTVLGGQSAQLVFYHNEIDPAMVGYIGAVVDGATSQLNRAIIKATVAEQQASAADYEVVLRQLQANLDDIRASLARGDRQRAVGLADSVRINSELMASLWLFSALPFSDPTAPAILMVQQARELDALLRTPQSDPQAEDAAIGQLQDGVSSMLDTLGAVQSIPPDVLASPLVFDIRGVSVFQPGYVAYHSPTVLALLVQHLCITLAALSLVDERNAGAIELFRVAPVGPGQILTGKFLAYVLLVLVTTLALVGLLIYGLRVPVLGEWRWFGLVIVLVMAHSLNLGFMISALATSRSQAIQMSMLVLLGSIFFSGFFIPVTDFALPVQAISYSLPVTYGISLLRQIVLRGDPPQDYALALLAAWAVVLGFLAVRTFRRQFVAR